MGNCYLQDTDINLLSEYFEILSSNKRKPQLSKELLGATPIIQSRNILSLLSFLLLYVYEYSYEDAQSIFSDYFSFQKFLSRHCLYGSMEYVVIYGAKGYISIGRNRHLILDIIYQNLDIEMDLKAIYNTVEKQRYNSEARYEYQQIKGLLQKKN